MKTFLGVRQKELDTIAYVVNQAKRSSKIEINRGDSADGNICRLVSFFYFVLFIFNLKKKDCDKDVFRLLDILSWTGLTANLFWVCIVSMAFPVVEFSRQGYKIRKVFG